MNEKVAAPDMRNNSDKICFIMQVMNSQYNQLKLDIKMGEINSIISFLLNKDSDYLCPPLNGV